MAVQSPWQASVVALPESPRTALIAQGLDDEAGSLLEQYADDPGAAWRYGRALWIFRREADSRDARERLRAAVRANRHVPAYFAWEREWPVRCRRLRVRR